MIMKTNAVAAPIIFAFLLVGIPCMAQQEKYLQQETDRNGNISFVAFPADSFPQPISQSANVLKELYLTRSADELKPSAKRQEQRDELGYTHRYYQQYYKNVRVEYGEVNVHANKQRNIETVSGSFMPVGEVITTPALTEAQALEYALMHVGAEVYKWQIPEEERWIREYYNSTYRPAGGIGDCERPVENR
jgi:Zn-dependent metalloprotease